MVKWVFEYPWLGMNYFGTIKWQHIFIPEEFVQLQHLLWFTFTPTAFLTKLSERNSQSSRLICFKLKFSVFCSSCCICVTCWNHLEGKWGRRSSSCSQCSLWDFFTPILLISLSWYLLRATLFYWDFMGENVLYKWNESTGCFWTNSGYLLEV